MTLSHPLTPLEKIQIFLTTTILFSSRKQVTRTPSQIT
ncbi:hypothetical protein CAEBREN_11456 [Caenorhabditis brenneri]|uniref:Uncharacterized protein n=1 Tax=Caenorhabditis brenneri TaxID=135651 RepID=G0NE33_CAEBE|nr:hypothetical protein CAEBREN_11456 [Caenorhabditis brenneri]